MIDRKEKLRQFAVVKAAQDDKDGILGTAFRSGHALVDQSEPGSELVGYAIVGVYSDGSTVTGWQKPDAHPVISGTLFKAIVLNELEEKL